MALYFDPKAQQSLGDGIGGVGRGMTFVSDLPRTAANLSG